MFQHRDYQLSFTIVMNDKVCTSALSLPLHVCHACALLICFAQDKSSYHFVVLDDSDFLLWCVNHAAVRLACCFTMRSCPSDLLRQARGAVGCRLPRQVERRMARRFHAKSKDASRNATRCNLAAQMILNRCKRRISSRL